MNRTGWPKLIQRSLLTAGVLCLGILPRLALAADKVSIRVDFTPAGTHGALHLALVEGWFKDEGLDVDLQDGKGSLNTIQLVGTGQVDIGQLSVGMVPVAQEGGMKVKSIAGFARRGDLAVLVPKESPYKSAQDLRGKRLVVFTASPWTPFIDEFLHNAGMTRNDVQVINVDVNALMTTYASGQADGILTLAPFSLPILEKTRPSRAIDAADYGIGFPGLGLVTREDVIASRPAVLNKVVQTTIRAWNYIYASHVDDAVAAIIKDRPDAKLDPSILRGQILAYKAYFDTPNTSGQPLGWQSEADWAAAIKTMVSAGVIKETHAPADFYTNVFIPR
jgi:NitT/TauT family transport system substrate-binding protein